MGLRGRPPLRSGHHLLCALTAYLVPLLAFDVAWPRRALPAAAPGAGALALQIGAALLAYDALFFGVHAALHHCAPLRAAHHAHHAQPRRTMRAAETLRLSLADGALQVACSVAALHAVRAHPLARAAFNVTITYWLSEIHSGYGQKIFFFFFMERNLIFFNFLF